MEMNTVVQKVKRDMCVGCSACDNICPSGALSMQPDRAGFLYPQLEEKKCISCGRCLAVCPALHHWDFVSCERLPEPSAQAAWSKDREIRMESTSGGVFSEVAKTFFQMGGYVVGARYDGAFLVEHYVGESVEDISLLRQSKYIQSDKKDVFQKIRALLKEGKAVLFVGAPCEVAGLYGFLGKMYDNLYTMDFICLGANAPRIYVRFLEMIEEVHGSKVSRVWFKNKTYGWHRFSTCVELQNGSSYLRDRDHDYFMRGYIGKSKLYIRPVCSHCRYKEIPRIGDMTLGDFWGIELLRPELDEDKGTSAVMLNSEKGKKLFERASEALHRADMTWRDIAAGNPALLNSVPVDPRQEQFFDDLERMRFDQLIERYAPMSWRRKIKDLFRHIMGR